VHQDLSWGRTMRTCLHDRNESGGKNPQAQLAKTLNLKASSLQTRRTTGKGRLETRKKEYGFFACREEKTVKTNKVEGGDFMESGWRARHIRWGQARCRTQGGKKNLKESKKIYLKDSIMMYRQKEGRVRKGHNWEALLYKI